jgi:hypothetical protein
MRPNTEFVTIRLDLAQLVPQRLRKTLILLPQRLKPGQGDAVTAPLKGVREK